jgi:regulator of sigma E protease
MDIVLMVLYGTVVLALVVFVHEAGHFLTARLFGVRVTEFMLGLPGPSIGFTRKGTRFGITIIPLGGYATICGMEGGELKPHLKETLALAYRKGTINMEDVAAELEISEDDAYAVLEQLVSWGSIVAPKKKDQHNTYRAPLVKGTYELGQSREVPSEQDLYDSEYKQQYRSLPFWKRSIILLGGIVFNLIFAILLFVLIFSVIGFDVQNTQTGLVEHMTVDPLRAITAGFSYIGMVIMAVLGLFNPVTAGETISNSTSIIGIAALSKQAAEQGIIMFAQFLAMISVSLGIMNLLPIPPLDGGRFAVEIVQKISRRLVPVKVMGYISVVGVLLFIGLFLVMLNQDIQRFVFGNW